MNSALPELLPPQAMQPQVPGMVGMPDAQFQPEIHRSHANITNFLQNPELDA
jgi:hypothetical protein